MKNVPFCKKLNFTDANKNRFEVEVEIEYPHITHGLKGRRVPNSELSLQFSASGNYGGSSGQCLDSINPHNNAQQKLVDMWKEYHLKSIPKGFLNDLTAIISDIEKAENEREEIEFADDAQLLKIIEEKTDFTDRDAQLCAAFVKMFDLKMDDLTDVEIDGNECKVQGIDYLAGNDDDMNDAVKEEIKRTCWAFNPSFLAEQTDLPIEVFEALVEKCEGAQDAIEKLIDKTCGMDEFAEAAESADGRAHFLNRYDGNEEEAEVEGITFYAYRQ